MALFKTMPSIPICERCRKPIGSVPVTGEPVSIELYRGWALARRDTVKFGGKLCGECDRSFEQVLSAIRSWIRNPFKPEPSPQPSDYTPPPLSSVSVTALPPPA